MSNYKLPHNENSWCYWRSNPASNVTAAQQQVCRPASVQFEDGGKRGRWLFNLVPYIVCGVPVTRPVVCGSGRQLSWEGASQRLGSVLWITVRDLKYLILDIFSHLWSQGWSKNKLKPRQSWLGGSHDHFGYAALLGSRNTKRFHKVRKSYFIEKEFSYNCTHSPKIARPHRVWSCKIPSLAKTITKGSQPWHFV